MKNFGDDFVSEAGLGLGEVAIAVLTTIALFLSSALVYLVRRWYFTKTEPVGVKFDEIPLPELSPFDGPGDDCQCEDCNKNRGNSCKRTYKPESMRAGSQISTIPRDKIPKVQVGVYSLRADGKLEFYKGVAVRLDEWLVVPYHVINKYEVVGILSNAPTPIAHKFQTARFAQIDGDLCAALLSEAEFSKLGLAKAPIAVVSGPTIAAIANSAAVPEMAFGILQNDPMAFGYVNFEGSTQRGFSGAPYMIGKHIAAIHQGGGQRNLGYNASYVMTMLKHPEETAEWLMKTRAKKGPLRYQRSKFDPDEVIVFIDGLYHIISKKDLDERGTDVEVEHVGPWKNDDYEPEVMVRESFPPKHLDIAEVAATMVNEVVHQVSSKNLEVAEECSAAQADDYMKMYHESMERLAEATSMIHRLQMKIADQYRADQQLVTQLPKSDPARAVVVTNMEESKKDLTEVNHLKTFVNVEASSVKEIPKAVKKAIAKKGRSGLLRTLAEQGFNLGDIAQAMVESKMVRENAPAVKAHVAQPAGNVADILAVLTEAANIARTKPSTSANSSD